MIIDLESIKKAAVDYFQEQLSGDHVSTGEEMLSNIPMMITEEDNAILDCFPTIEEVHKLIGELDANSTAGPDGFTASFYQSSWEMIKDDFFNDVLEFFAGFEQPKAWHALRLFQF